MSLLVSAWAARASILAAVARREVGPALVMDSHMVEMGGRVERTEEASLEGARPSMKRSCEPDVMEAMGKVRLIL